VDGVARLARLALTPEERDRMQGQLAVILEYVAVLGRVDVTDVEPTSHVLPLVNVTREDEVRPSYPVAAMLANAPDAADGLVRVPRILED
jgi:aspartyl-tRNA(Asn)/glutamyl-tRNA(Gln) amidotransferase subunit C